VPPNHFTVTRRVGAVLVGALDGDQVIGFVFSLAGLRDRVPIHWSELMGVMPDYRNQGLGRRMKLKQRELCLAAGVGHIEWSYDPMVARNAHFNINLLGVDIVDYIPDFYLSTGSKIHTLKMDRTIAVWNLESARVLERIDARVAPVPVHDAAVLNNPDGSTELEPLAAGAAVRVEIPADIWAIAADDHEAANAWQSGVRASFTNAMAAGFTVSGFYRDPDTGRCFYILGNTTESS
jgi:predicted GNAT superfamily acetyltransferase